MGFFRTMCKNIMCNIFGLVEPDVIEAHKKIYPFFKYIKKHNNGKYPTHLFCDYYLFGYCQRLSIEFICMLGERDKTEMLNKSWKVLALLYEISSLELLSHFKLDSKKHEYDMMSGANAAKATFDSYLAKDDYFLNEILFYIDRIYGPQTIR
ncbi:MAG TPA: hypothetical protein DCZ63_08650 [Geobacter sp.]|nr:hypothetical protein [Geobacter sp.]